MSKRYYTVVYEIHNEEAFKRVAGAATGSMASGTGPIDGVAVTACGDGDVMTAYDALSDQCLEDGHSPDDVVLAWCEENDISPEEAKLIIG